MSFTISWNLLKFMSIESVMPSNHLILCQPLLLMPSIFSSIRVFSNESVLPIRWPKYQSFSFSISPSNEYLGLISFKIDWFDLPVVFFFNFYFYFILLYNTVLVLPYIDMNQPRVYMSSQSWTSLLPPTPYYLSGSSQCTSPKHPVSCIKYRLVIRFLPDSIHVPMPFSQIIPPSPSPTESKSLFYTSVSLLLSHI